MFALYAARRWPSQNTRYHPPVALAIVLFDRSQNLPRPLNRRLHPAAWNRCGDRGQLLRREVIAEKWLDVRNARLRSEAAHFVLKRVEGSECAADVVAIEVTPRAWRAFRRPLVQRSTRVRPGPGMLNRGAVALFFRI